MEISGTALVIPVFKTIKLGLFKTAETYISEMRKAGCSVSRPADGILRNPEFTCAVEEIELDLVNLSGTELGFRGVVSYAEILDRASEIGLSVCPAEVGPALRLAYTDQRGDEWLVIDSIVRDQQYLTQPYLTSVAFKKIPDASGWDPTTCRADQPR